MGILTKLYGLKTPNVHTSGMAEAAETEGNPVSQRSTAHQGFEVRQNINHNRKVVRAYRDASVLHEYRADAQEEFRRQRAIDNFAKQADAQGAEAALEELHKSVEEGNYPSHLKRRMNANEKAHIKGIKRLGPQPQQGAEAALEELHKSVEEGNYPSHLKRRMNANEKAHIKGIKRLGPQPQQGEGRGRVRVDNRPTGIQQSPLERRMTFRDKPGSRYNPYA